MPDVVSQVSLHFPSQQYRSNHSFFTAGIVQPAKTRGEWEWEHPLLLVGAVVRAAWTLCGTSEADNHGHVLLYGDTDKHFAAVGETAEVLT